MIRGKTLEADLNKFNIMFGYYDYDSLEEVPVEQANCINLSSIDQDSEVYIPIGTYIRTPKKKPVTLEWILEKVNKASQFKNLTEHMKKVVSGNNIDVYPTSYGVGMFRLFGIEKGILVRVKKFFDDNNIEYTNEFSDARWVYRFKVSKKAENIKRLKEILS